MNMDGLVAIGKELDSKDYIAAIEAIIFWICRDKTNQRNVNELNLSWWIYNSKIRKKTEEEGA